MRYVLLIPLLVMVGCQVAPQPRAPKPNGIPPSVYVAPPWMYSTRPSVRSGRPASPHPVVVEVEKPAALPASTAPDDTNIRDKIDDVQRRIDALRQELN